VVPAIKAMTIPLLFTDATNGSVLLQVPPEVPVELKAADAPMHKVDAPVNVPAFTFGSTVNDAREAIELLQLFNTV
jgi:hypothetical protein